MPQYIQIRYLAYLTIFKGPEASDAATRLLTGTYPAELKADYEPHPLTGFTALRDLDTQRFMPPSDTELEIDKAASAGDWRTAAALLDQTWRRWDERSHVTYLLSKAAVKNDSWLKEWEESEPDNPGALLVRANRTVRYAWEVRGALRARHLTDKQIHGFRHYIELAEGLMEQAIAAAPEDPTPYRYMLRIARGRGWSHSAMENLWEEFTSRHPHGFDGHLSALQYWCAKWRGSHDKARSFAVAAAENAPKGTFLSVLPLIAAFEQHGLTAHRQYRTRQVKSAVDSCLEELSSFGEVDSHIVRQVRHVLAYFLNRLGRHGEAVEQFRAIDGHIFTLPWSYYPNTVQEYGWFRRDSVRRQR
ncbi:hypothetical protein [Glycomyces sp. YM15]|uniref:hypothetical protein n=1 Tax=Glycomyces sp. YM15 TaxID=2800446 RepID=UPI00196434B9|nr:hypothetical protein [Glycomyces sp. YM15]